MCVHVYCWAVGVTHNSALRLFTYKLIILQAYSIEKDVSGCGGPDARALARALPTRVSDHAGRAA